MRAACLLLPLLLFLGCGDAPPTREPLDPRIAALIHDLVDGTDSDKRMAAHDALQTHGVVVVEPLAHALDREDVDASVGAWIAEVLGGLGPVAAPAAPALFRRLMQGGDCSATTSWALGQVGDAGVPYLARALSSPHQPTRLWASDALGNLEKRAAPAADALLGALDDPDAEVRTNAAWAIAHLPTVHERAQPRLLVLTNDPHEEVRLGAAGALAARGAVPAVRQRLLRMILEEPDAYTRVVVLESLDPHLGGDTATLAVLRKVADPSGEETDLSFRARAMLLQRGVDEPALVEAMAQVEGGEDFEVILSRAEVLGQSGPNGRQASLPLLCRTLAGSPEEADRVRAARMLGGLGTIAAGDDATLRLLTEQARNEHEEPAVKAACAAALGALRMAR
jgi:HEAT repeat protein